MQYNQRQYNKDKWLTSKQSLLYSQKYETRLINPKESQNNWLKPFDHLRQQQNLVSL